MNAMHMSPEMAIENKVLLLSRKESERGFVVLIMAYLEARLRVLSPDGKRLSDCINEAHKNGMLSDDLSWNLHKMRCVRNMFAHHWDVSELDHECVRGYVDSLRIDPKWVMPERCHSKEYVSNVLAYAAFEINREITVRKIESVC